MDQSHRIAAVQDPIIPDVAALIRSQPGTIALGQGVVHYPPPPQAFAAIETFGNSIADHHYQAAAGLPLLQEQLGAKLEAENGISLADNQVLMVTAGSNMAFYHSVLALADPGDEIIIMSPYYFNHQMAIVMANCTPVAVATDADYQPDLDAIEAAIGQRTRAIVTISPNNPTGAVYSPQTLGAINDLCRRRGLYHICDEAYEYFTYDGARHFSPGSLPNSADHTLSLFSFSKSYGFASWRIGYMVAPHRLLRPLEKIQDTILICPPTITQTAALGALEAGRTYCRPFIEAMAQTRQHCLGRLAALGDRCQVPSTQGAFYLLARLQTPLSAMEIVEKLVRQYQVAAIPGTAFGLDQACYLRIAYGALKADTTAEGLARLTTGLDAILTGT